METSGLESWVHCVPQRMSEMHSFIQVVPKLPKMAHIPSALRMWGVGCVWCRAMSEALAPWSSVWYIGVPCRGRLHPSERAQTLRQDLGPHQNEARSSHLVISKAIRMRCARKTVQPQLLMPGDCKCIDSSQAFFDVFTRCCTI
jgi:hypothetical protein